MAKRKKKLPKRKIVKAQAAPEHPWDRQVEETDAAWAGFVGYRDLGPAERSLVKAARNVGKHPRVFEEWSQKWDWVARCHAFDAFMDRRKREADLAEIEAMRRRHIQMAMSLQGAAALALNKIVAAEHEPLRDEKGKILVDEKGKPLLGPLTLKPSEVRDLAELGVKLERLNRGEPDSIQEQRHELTVEDRRKSLQDAARSGTVRMAIRKALAEARGEVDERSGGPTKH